MTDTNLNANPPLGIAELKQLALAASDVAAAFDGVFADGKVNLADVTRLPGLLNALKECYDVPYGVVYPEIVDLSPAEALELSAYFKSVFNISNDNVESIIEAGVDIIARAVEAIGVIKDIINKIKGVTPHVA